MNRIAFFVLLALGFAGLAWGQEAPAKPLPLYDAFQTFCVKTEGSLGAVEKAMKQAGGKPHIANPSEQKIPAMTGQTRSIWDVTISGHAFTVLTSNDEKRLMVFKNPTTSCVIVSSSNEDDSIAAITNWIGVPPVKDSFAGFMQRFQYEQDGDRRSALETETPDINAAAKILNVMRSGHFWTLIMIGAGTDRASITLVHVLAAPPGAMH